MSIRERLIQIVGANNFSDDPKVLGAYSKDFSLSPPGMPNYVVRPQNADEVAKVVALANEFLIPVVPVSSAVHFYGSTIPKQGGIVVDLARMNKILEIDGLNKRVRVEAGVNWEQLTTVLAEKGFRVIMPLLPHPQRSVVTDHLEMEVPTNTVYDYGEPLQSMEVVWPTGEVFRTGSASVTGYPNSVSRGGNPAGPGIDFYRLLQRAQGTMGIVTWANLKIQYIPKIDELLLAPIHDLSYAIEFLYRTLRLRIGQECFLFNSMNMAAIIAEGSSADFEKVQASLPPWTLILVVSGLQRRPEEKVKYEKEALSKIVRSEFNEISLGEALPGFPGLARKLLPMLRRPWPKETTFWKNRYKGACQSLFFITRPVLAPKFIATVEQIAPKHDYPVRQIGVYVQPIEHNRACHLEFEFFYNPSSSSDAEMVRNLCRNAAQTLVNEGALFTRPYGELARMVYERATSYVATLRRVKKLFDPNNIMNPGNLCF